MWAPTKLNQIQRIIEWRPLNCFLLAHIEPNRTAPTRSEQNISHILFIYLFTMMNVNRFITFYE